MLRRGKEGQPIAGALRLGNSDGRRRPLGGNCTAAAAEAAKQMPPDFRVSITNAPGKGVYPVSSFTWLLLYENAKDKDQAKTMVEFMKWALTDGQKYCADLGYAPLPDAVVKLELAALGKIKTS